MGLAGRGFAVLANASTALALSSPTPRVQLSVHSVRAISRSEAG